MVWDGANDVALLGGSFTRYDRDWTARCFTLLKSRDSLNTSAIITYV